MAEGVGDNLFEAVAASVGGLRAAVEGRPGADLRTLGDARGPLADLIRTLLRQLHEVLLRLRRLALAAETKLREADAALAGLEVLSDGLKRLTDPTIFAGLAERLGVPATPFEQLAQVATTGQQGLEAGLELARFLPAPETLARIRGDLDALTGVPDAPAGPRGALQTLLDEIGAAAAEDVAAPAAPLAEAA